MTTTLPKEIVLCSGNKGKIREFNKTGEKFGINFTAISEIIGEEFDPAETEDSFHGNALLKAKAGAKLTKQYCLADDSGIEFDAFDKRPGIYSGRFLKTAQESFLLNDTEIDDSNLPSNYEEDLQRKTLETVIKNISKEENKNCRFVCSLALVNPEGEEVLHIQETWEGKVSDHIKGTDGFGYDPIVIPNEYPDKTVAELGSEIKNQISHRAKAIKSLIDLLKT